MCAGCGVVAQACALLDDDGVAALAGVGRTLLSADLSGCRALRGRTLRALARGCPALRELRLEDCAGLREEGLARALPALAPALAALHVGGCRALGDGLCARLHALRLPLLRELSLRGCERLTTR